VAKKVKKTAKRRALTPSALAREQGTALPARQVLSTFAPGPEVVPLPIEDVGGIGFPDREPYHTLPVEPGPVVEEK
jgi:hypothetical protein